MRVVKGKFGSSPVPKPAKKLFSMAPEAGESEYQASEWFVPSKDAQGHSVRISTMVTPDMKREILTILSRRTVPLWDTEGDLIRWCLHLGLVTLMKRVKDPHVRSAHAVMASWTELQKRLNESRYWGSTLFPALRGEIAALVKKGDYIPATELLRTAEAMIDHIGDEYWRQKFTSEIVEYYAYVKTRAKVQEKKMRKERGE